MVQYRTSYRQNPSAADAGKLINYCARGDVGRVERAAGVTATKSDIDGFQRLASNAELCRMHSFTFAENYSPKELTNRVRDTLKDHLDGSYLVGVDVNDGNNHIHVAQAGSWDEVYFDQQDIADIREAVADQVGETVAAKQVKA